MSTDKNLLIDLWLISFLAERFVAEMLEGIPLSVDEFAMYGLISDLAPLTAADLVRATGLPATTVSSLVRRCESRGELIRSDNPEDARSSLLELTAAGYEVLASAVPRLLEGIDRLRSRLGTEHDLVRERLELLDQVLRQEMGVGPRPYEVDVARSYAKTLTYSGPALTPEQRAEALRFVDWLRKRDA